MSLLATLVSVLSIAGSSYGQVTSIGANFTSLTVKQVAAVNGGGFSVPPDTMGVIGNNHYLQYTNGGVVFSTNKDGSAAGAMSSESNFWSARAGVAGVSPSGDPRVMYDPLAGRYFAVAFTGEATNNSILIARSDTSDPTGTWKGTKIATNTGVFADFPTLGLNRNGLTIGINNFNTSGSFTNVDVYTIPVADLLASTPSLTNMTKFTNTVNATGFAVQGVNNFNLGQTTSTAGQIIARNGLGSTTIRYSTITGQGGAGATLGAGSNITVGSTSVPPGAFQPNATNTGTSTTKIDTGDTRISSSVNRVGNFIYSASSTTVNSLGALRVTVQNATTGALISEATVGGGTADPNFSSYFPSIAANANGNIVLSYSRSGFISSGNAANRYVGSYATIGTFNGTTLSFGATPIELKAGVRDYVSFQGTAADNRWGDYSATSLDPSDPGIFWTTQEYAAATVDGVGSGSNFTNWATQVTELMPAVTGEKRWSSISASLAGGITGNFSTAANWYNGIVPTTTDHVIFSRNGDGVTNYTVTFGAGTTTVDRTSVRQGNVTFSIGSGNTFSMTNGVSDTPSLSVAEYLGVAKLTVSGGGTLSTVTTTIAAGRNSDASYNGVSGAFNASRATLTITGNGTTWNNSGSVYLGGSDTNAGGVGVLEIDGGAMANISGNLTIYNAGTGITANSVTVGATSAATLNVAGLTNTGSGTVVPTVNLANAASSLNVNGSINSTFTGTILGTGVLTKSGTGTFTLGGTNTYTGTTTVNGGTLAINGNNSSATGAVTVNSGGQLSGTGTVGGAITVNSGGTLQAGSGGIGTLEVNNNVTINSGGILRSELGVGNTADRINLSGGNNVLNLNNGAVIGLTASGFTSGSSSATFLLANLNGTTSTLLTVNGSNIATNTLIATFTSSGNDAGTDDNANLSFSLSGFAFSSGQTLQLRRDAVGDLVIVFVPVPEPAFLFGGAIAMLATVGYGRKYFARSPAKPLAA